MSENSGKKPEDSPRSARFDPAQETFVANVRVGDETRRGVFTVMGGEDAGMVISIPGGNIVTMGRSPDCTIRFDDGNLSRLHAHLMRVGSEYIFSDAKSKNGSYLNDTKVEAATPLRDGDRVQLGSSVKLRFALVGEAEEQALRDMFIARRRGGLMAAFERADQRGEELLDDLLQARDFQQRTLPQPPTIAGVDIEVLYRPLDLVGGDLYQVTSLRDGVLRVFIADATGHGVRASLTTVLIMSEYEFVKRDPDGPAKVLAALNDRIATTFQHLSVHFTASCLDFDLRNGVLKLSSAAHPPPFLVREGQAQELDSGGAFVGLVPEVEYPEWSYPIQRGDYVVTFTDGATEVFNAAGDPFGEERLQATVATAVATGQPVSAAVTTALERFVGPQMLADDLTIVSIGWRG